LEHLIIIKVIGDGVIEEVLNMTESEFEEGWEVFVERKVVQCSD
jgi:hypothetical protein